MIKEIMKKRKIKINTLKNEIQSLKDELLEAYRKIDKKDQLIVELYCVRDEKQRKIDELLEELKEYREKKVRKSK